MHFLIIFLDVTSASFSLARTTTLPPHPPPERRAPNASDSMAAFTTMSSSGQEFSNAYVEVSCES